MCSSSGTSHLAAWLILLGGGPKAHPHFWGVFHIPCPFPQSFGDDTMRQPTSQQEESPASLGGVPSSGGESVPVTAVP